MGKMNVRPACKRSDCFACIEEHCICLSEKNFRGGCPFYKTEEEYRKGLKDYPPQKDVDTFRKYENSRREAKAKSNLKNYY